MLMRDVSKEFNDGLNAGLKASTQNAADISQYESNVIFNGLLSLVMLSAFGVCYLLAQLLGVVSL